MSRTRTRHLRLVAEILRSRRENAHLLVNPIPKLTIVLIWKSPACLKFGKTSNRVVKNLPQRKLWAWAGNDARSHKNLIRPNFGERVLLRKRIDLRILEFGLTSTRCPSTTSERVTNLHIPVPAITCGTLARLHELKSWANLFKIWCNLLPSAFPLKNGWAAPSIFQGKSPGDEVGFNAMPAKLTKKALWLVLPADICLSSSS